MTPNIMTNSKATGKGIIIEQIKLNALIIRNVISVFNMIMLYNTDKLNK